MAGPLQPPAVNKTGSGRDADILIDTPIVRHAGIVPANEDRSYILFIAGALGMALGGGFVLAVLVSLAETGVLWEGRVPWLIQAHGWAQLQGWAGLFVAGMGLRLLPRFAGRHPLPKAANVAIFIPLLAGTVLRTIAQAAGAGGFAAGGLLVGALLWSVGATAFGVVTLVTLARGRGGLQPWRAFAATGACWWIAWAAFGVVAGSRGAHNDGYVPSAFDDTLTWMVMLGALGNFTWAVQSRSVPIFFGRRPPTLRALGPPWLVLNAGAALLGAAALAGSDGRASGAGLLLCGGALLWLAPTAGSCWGTPRRLRPRARSAARFVLFANLAAAGCGMLLLWAGARTMVEGGFAAAPTRDAARHAFGLGTLTLLIVGMAQLVAPFFALARVQPQARWLAGQGVFWLLASAALLRVASALTAGNVDNDIRLHVAALAGSLAWAGLLVFAVTVWRAARGEREAKAALAAAITH